ncbi:patatin-like phospholipase family protein [bacterium]|nr:patatin-like phospholipase family protein [bacterium]
MSQKIGLALAGGAARGYAHIGVLKILEREGINIDFIAGTSMGSLVGAYYAGGFSPAEIEEMAIATKRRHITSIGFSKKGLLSTRKINKMLSRDIGNRTFQDLAIPLSVVTTDILTGEEVVISTGSVKEAVLASISVAGVFPPRELSGRLLIDGGYVNQVPVSVVRNMGADFVIAVVVGFWSKKRNQYSNAVQIAIRAIDIMAGHLAAKEEENADIVIKPDVESESLAAYHKSDFFIKAGAEATEEAIPMIKTRI